MRFARISPALAAVLSAACWAQTPAIRAVANNYSNIAPGLPNYGIAQGSIFVIYGSDLAPSASALQSVPLKTTLDGVTVSVTVNGATTNALIYFVSPTQIDAILPSATPVGTGTVTVTNGNEVSPQARIDVVASAFGLLTVNGGTGMVKAYNGSNEDQFLGPGASANPDEVIVLWGSGLGPVAGDESVTQQPSDMTTPIEVDIGGIPAEVNYHGRSQFPGLDQINVVVPHNVSGCAVSVAVRTDSYISNFGTIPVTATGRTCSDDAAGLTASQVQDAVAKGSYSAGTVTLIKTATTGPSGVSESGHPIPGTTTTAESGSAAFHKTSTASGVDVSSLLQTVSTGSCLVYTGSGSTVNVPAGPNSTALNAGSKIDVAAAGGTQTLTLANGAYSATFPAGFVDAGGYTISNGAGGPDVGPFSVQLTVPAPLSWPDLNNFNVITRSGGVTVNWTGGDPGTYVTISGLSTGNGNAGGTGVYGFFRCAAPAAAHTFTVPPTVLTSLPASALVEGVSSSTLSIGNTTAPKPFTPSGPALDYSAAQATFEFSKIVTYQ